MLTQSSGAWLILQAGPRLLERNMGLLVVFFLLLYCCFFLSCLQQKQLINVSSSSVQKNTNAEQEESSLETLESHKSSWGRVKQWNNDCFIRALRSWSFRSSTNKKKKVCKKCKNWVCSERRNATFLFCGLFQLWACTWTARIICSEGQTALVAF